MLLVHDSHPPSPEDWREYVDAYAHAVRHHGVRRLLVVSDGGGPNAKQRNDVIAALLNELSPPQRKALEREFKNAVCSSSLLARGITTALSWVTTAQFNSFAYADWDRALDYLEVTTEERQKMLAECRHLVDDLKRSRQ